MSKWKYYANYGDVRAHKYNWKSKKKINAVISRKQRAATFRNGSAFRLEKEEVDKCVRNQTY